MKHDFKERRENRIKFAKSQAAKNQRESDLLYQQAQEMSLGLSLAQPISLGKGSAACGDRYQQEIHRVFCKSVEKQAKAALFEKKAEAIERNKAIFADDPEAVDKLKAKLSRLKALQGFMEAANKCVEEKDRGAFLLLPYATQEGWDRLNSPGLRCFAGFPARKLANNKAMIRAVERRIRRLGEILASPAFDAQIGKVRLWENKVAGRLQLIFESKPNEETRRELKAHGFRWSASQGVWQRHISSPALYIAKLIAAKLV